jgi:hypothetical protein
MSRPAALVFLFFLLGSSPVRAEFEICHASLLGLIGLPTSQLEMEYAQAPDRESKQRYVRALLYQSRDQHVAATGIFARKFSESDMTFVNLAIQATLDAARDEPVEQVLRPFLALTDEQARDLAIFLMVKFGDSTAAPYKDNDNVDQVALASFIIAGRLDPGLMLVLQLRWLLDDHRELSLFRRYEGQTISELALENFLAYRPFVEGASHPSPTSLEIAARFHPRFAAGFLAKPLRDEPQGPLSKVLRRMFGEKHGILHEAEFPRQGSPFSPSTLLPIYVVASHLDAERAAVVLGLGAELGMPGLYAAYAPYVELGDRNEPDTPFRRAVLTYLRANQTHFFPYP